MMVDTFYLHLEFVGKGGVWSINLPFLCTKCGVCCTLEDFLMAGEITAKPEEKPELHAKIRALYEELGKRWETNEAKYDEYTMHNPCPFLVNHTCSIYEARPEGCRRFPNTAFGMLTQDCEALARFKKQRGALRRGRTAKETYHSTGTGGEPIKPTKFTEKQYRTCIANLHKAGITEDELTLFNSFNGKKPATN